MCSEDNDRVQFVVRFANAILAISQDHVPNLVMHLQSCTSMRANETEAVTAARARLVETVADSKAKVAAAKDRVTAALSSPKRGEASAAEANLEAVRRDTAAADLAAEDAVRGAIAASQVAEILPFQVDERMKYEM